MISRFVISYEITADAALDAGRLAGAGFIRGFRIVFALVAVAGIPLAFLTSIGVGVGVATFGLIMLAFTYVRFIDRWFLNNRSRGIMGQRMEYVVDDDGIHYQHPMGSGLVPWSGLTHLRTDERTVVFARDRVVAAYVPTSAFGSDAERASFIAFARAHLPGG
jgi:hypothetical protein